MAQDITPSGPQPTFTLVDLIYKHQCGCSLQGEEVVVRPNIANGAYPQVNMVCVETGKSLYLNHTDRS